MVEFSPDGREIGVAAANTVTIWSVDSGRVLREFILPRTGDQAEIESGQDHETTFASFGWLPDGRRIVFEGAGQVGLLDVDTGDVLWTVTDPDLDGAVVSPRAIASRSARAGARP
ncbi:WD40 repeat domain-containing protein [Paractinoplanes durhamensis]|uniref:hypothetical protein n=1 Tax=Paractinoplanes durhamensis TaxID=113563 RepID=UPI0036336ACE